MKYSIQSFYQLLNQAKHDIMLIIMFFIPIITGIFFRFGIPLIGELLEIETFLFPYYSLIDTFLILFVSPIFNYVVAMIVLEEYDEHVTSYLIITPLGIHGYLLSRLGFISILSIPISIILHFLFHLSDIYVINTLFLSLIGMLQGIISAMIMITFSKNKVEGMALGKMTTLFNMAIILPYIITSDIQYLLSIFPTFWISKYLQSSMIYNLVISVLVALLWIIILNTKFHKKLFS